MSQRAAFDTLVPMHLPPRLHPGQLLTIGVVTLLLVAVLVIAPATLHFEAPRTETVSRTVNGTVVRVLDEHIDTSPLGETLNRTVEVATEARLVTVQQQLTSHSERMLAATPGDRMLLTIADGPDGEATFFIVDRVRRPMLVLLAATFSLLVVAIGGWQGLRSLVGLAVSFAVILRFVVPGVIAGYSPVGIAAVGSLAVMAATLTLTRGATVRSATAFAGTAFALLLTVLLASGTFAIARISGLAEENALTVGAIFGGIDHRGLLLAGIVIGALGVLDDVTMAQSSTVFELQRANPTLGAEELFLRGMVVGRDHIASTVNTLVLAYAGASLPLLLLLLTAAEPLGTMVNREILAVEIIRSLTGSIGLVAAVPFTTLVAAFVAAHYEHTPPPPVGSAALRSACRAGRT
ncbi:MAG: YibE/F family protein [Dehalococcoidia bacterium]|nr:YibE/F family protein [Dehalococcoidia bacterium]